MNTTSFLVIGLLTLAIYKLIIWFINRKEFYSKFNQFPGPKGVILLGNALDFKSSKDLIPKLMKYQNKHGLTFKIHLRPEPYIFTADPKIIEIITSSNKHINKNMAYKFLEDWIGEGLISAKNPRWKEHRRLITPTFHFNILKDFLPIFQKNADNLVNHWKRCIGKQKSVDIEIFDDLLASALDSLCETAMGIKVNALQEGKRSKYINSIKFMGENLMDRTFSFWKQFDFLYKRSAIYQKELEYAGYIKKSTDDVIKQKRLQMSNSKFVNTEDQNGIGIKKRAAFLDHLMTSNGGSMSDKDLREEVDTFIFAGHDTTASSVSFFLYNISRHSDVQQKLYEEVMEVFGDEKYITYEKLSDLKYMEMVIKESMRLHPTVPVIFRELSEDLNCNNGKTIPKGSSVGIFIYGSSRNGKVFENPEKFDPERFNPMNIGKYGAFAYVPFSAGPRNCIGQKFAWVELKALLSMLIKEFKFSKLPGFEVQPVAETVLKSINGVHVVVECRH